MRVLVTCPAMLGMLEEFLPTLEAKRVEVEAPHVIQVLDEESLIGLVPRCDGWIIGDDPATFRVFLAGRRGRLKAAVKWGVGTDNVDVSAAERLGIAITHTPHVFGPEVSDVAVGYVIALARETFHIDRQVREGLWPKPRGISLKGKTVGLIGFGDIGRNAARKLLAFDLNVVAYDPAYSGTGEMSGVTLSQWPERLGECDFLVFTCSLNAQNRHMLDEKALECCKAGVRIVNVARGPLISEKALIGGLESGKVHSAALDVTEVEPLPTDSKLRIFEKCVFGSHNASNTTEAVRATSLLAISKLFHLLGIDE